MLIIITAFLCGGQIVRKRSCESDMAEWQNYYYYYYYYYYHHHHHHHHYYYYYHFILKYYISIKHG